MPEKRGQAPALPKRLATNIVLLCWPSHGQCGSRGEGAAEGFLPFVEVDGSGGFHVNAGNGGKKESGDVSQRRGAFPGDAILGEHFPELAEGVIDVGGGAKFAGDGFEFLADALGFEEKAFLAGVEGAES